MRRLVLASMIFATGCFRWAPASSLSSIEDDRVQIHDGSRFVTLEHATASGRTIEGQTRDGRVEQFDASEAHVLVRRLNVPATVGIVAGSAVLVAGTVFFGVLLAILLTPQAIP